MPTKLHEIKLLFLVAPLDDLYGAKTPVLAKWQVKEAMMQMFDEYIDKMMGDGEYVSVVIGGKVQEARPSDDPG